MKKRKKTPRRILLIKLIQTAKLIAKKRDKYTCCKCGKRCQGSNAHASHIIPVSSGTPLRWDPKNIITMCFHDHINWWHKNPLEAGEWFLRKYPDRYEYLRLERRRFNETLKKVNLEHLNNDLENLKGELTKYG